MSVTQLKQFSVELIRLGGSESGFDLKLIRFEYELAEIICFADLN